jgi:hypothetical protein
MKITNIEKQKTIVCDLMFILTINMHFQFLMKKKEFDLKEGIDIDEEQYNYYVNFLVNKSAYNDSLKFLSYSMRTKKSLLIN